MVKYATIDVHASIVPGQGLGGITLRTPVIDLQDLLTETFVVNAGKPAWFQMEHLFEVRYRLDAVEVSVDVRNGKIFKVTALEGYQGKLFNKITLGMIVSDAMAIEPRLFYDEAEELLLVRGCQGVSLEVAAVDPDPASVPALPIVAISVVAEAAFTAAGPDGRQIAPDSSGASRVCSPHDLQRQ